MRSLKSAAGRSEKVGGVSTLRFHLIGRTAGKNRIRIIFSSHGDGRECARKEKLSGERGRESERAMEKGTAREMSVCAPGFQPSQQRLHLARRASFFLGVRPDFLSAQNSPTGPACLVGKKLCTLPHSPIYIHCKEDLAANPDWFQNFQPNSGWDYPRYFEIEKKDSFWRIEKDFVWTDLRNNPWGVQHRR